MKDFLKYTFLLFFMGLLCSSCEKVIDLHLDNTDPVLVIEGSVVNRIDTQFVKISRSSAIKEGNSSQGVSGATVTITNQNGVVYTLRERSAGIYSARRFRGIPGNSYYLKVLFEGKEYTASSVMPIQVNIDSIGVTTTTFFNTVRKSVQVLFNDPSERKNYYRFLLGVNGVKTNSIFVFNDDFNNGNKVTRELFDVDLELNSGDVAEVEVQCIDSAIYRYWQGIDQNRSRGGASTTPANPVSNISNGALGYFSAHTQQIQTINIP